MREASPSGSNYFHIWLGIKVLLSSHYWSPDAGSERMKTSVLTFAIVFDAMVADSKTVEDEESEYIAD